MSVQPVAGIPAQPELALLREGVRADPDPGHLQAIAQGPMDWDLLQRSALHEGVLPVLYQTLAAHCPDQVPAPAMASLAAAFHHIALRNRLLAEELIALLDLLAGRGIAALPFKGPTLAIMAYGGLSQRQFGDLDLLVQHQDLAGALAALEERGYRRFAQLTKGELAPFPALTPAQHRWHRKHYHEHELMHPQGLAVDLHWALLEARYWFRPRPERFSAHPRTLTLAGRSVPSPATEALLYLLVAHGTKERWRKLGWIVDLDRLIRRHPALDWNRVRADARAVRGDEVLRYALARAVTLLGTPLPESMRRFALAKPWEPLVGDGGTRRFNSLCTNPWDRAVYAARATFSTGVPAFVRTPYPDPLFFLYYLAGPRRRLGRLVSQVKRRLSPGAPPVGD